jgi:DNA gyrase/topoisomerase IV subunit B
MRELAYLNKGIKISLTDKRKKVEGDFFKWRILLSGGT